MINWNVGLEVCNVNTNRIQQKNINGTSWNLNECTHLKLNSIANVIKVTIMENKPML